jgi:hypothetical protein
MPEATSSSGPPKDVAPEKGMTLYGRHATYDEYMQEMAASGVPYQQTPGGGVRFDGIFPKVARAPASRPRTVRPTRAGRTTVIGRTRSSRRRGRAQARAPDDPDGEGEPAKRGQLDVERHVVGVAHA